MLQTAVLVYCQITAAKAIKETKNYKWKAKKKKGGREEPSRAEKKKCGN